MGRVMVLLVVLLSLVCVTTAQTDTLILRRADGSTYEMEGEVKCYKDGKFIIGLSTGGETSFSIDQVQAIVFSEASSKAVAFRDRLTLREHDGTTYVLKGRIKHYEDNRFTVVPSSGKQKTFPIEQVQLIEFGEEKEETPRRIMNSPKQEAPSGKTRTHRQLTNFSFRGIKWGTDIASLEDMQYYKTRKEFWRYGSIEVYTRKNDDLCMGKAKFYRIEYHFWKGKFFKVYILTYDYPELKKAIFERFGEGYQSKKGIENYTWVDNKTEMILEYKKYVGTLTMCSVELLNEVLVAIARYKVDMGTAELEDLKKVADDEIKRLKRPTADDQGKVIYKEKHKPYIELNLRDLQAEPQKYLEKRVKVGPLKVVGNEISRASFRTHPSTGSGRSDYDVDVSIEVFYDKTENPREWRYLSSDKRHVIYVIGMPIFYKSSQSNAYISANKIILEETK